jgi:hypothetical protein
VGCINSNRRAHISVIDTGEERYDFSEKEVENKDKLLFI